jgi:hypothetical protein
MQVKNLGRAAVVCAPLLLLLGCGRVPGQFIILDNKVPMAGCAIPSDVMAAYRGDGILDVAIVNDQTTSAYLVFPLLENDLPGPSTGQNVDGNRIALSGFDVDIQLAKVGNPPMPPTFPPLTTGLLTSLHASRDGLVIFGTQTSGTVASGGGHTSSLVEAFPAQLATMIRGFGELNTGTALDVDLRISARGNTLNGSITSDDFVFPIKVCDGCLVASSQLCPVKNTPANVGNPCNPAQDDPVDCCTIGGSLICPSVVGQ